jgi:hypothetical protein
MKAQQMVPSSPFLQPILQRLQDRLAHPALHPPVWVSGSQINVCRNPLKLAIAYNGTPRSHAALDLAFWIAHQTRVATAQIVMVHVVYVSHSDLKGSTLALSKADEILHQARLLADEWRGHLYTHLRFGDPTDELKQVVAQEGIHLLIVGCESAHHPFLDGLADCPCTVLGIPRLFSVPGEITWVK